MEIEYESKQTTAKSLNLMMIFGILITCILLIGASALIFFFNTTKKPAGNADISTLQLIPPVDGTNNKWYIYAIQATGDKLDLGGKKIGVEGARAVALALVSGKLSSNFTVVDIQQNGIGDEGAKAIAAALESGNCLPSLEHISLTGNKLTVEGAKAIGGALASGKCPPNFQRIDFAENSIGDAGMKAIFDKLRGNCASSLLIMNVTLNSLSGTQAISEFLKSSGQCSKDLKIFPYSGTNNTAGGVVGRV